MRWVGFAVLLVVTFAGDVSAQSSRVYVGGTGAFEAGGRGSIDLDVVPAAGAVLGLRLTPAWSVEFEADRGFATSPERVSEGLVLSFVGPAATPEERERNGIFARSRFTDMAGAGYSVHVMWRTRDPARVNAALFGGISWRSYEVRHIRTVTAVGPGVPVGHPERESFDRRRTTTGGGYTAGFMVPVQIRRAVIVAPTVRFTLGASDGEFGYKALYMGVRLLWGF